MRIELKKFGEILISRPAGREAALVVKSYFPVAPSEKIELDFTGVLSVAPSWLDEFMLTLEEAFGPDRIVCLPSDNLSVIESLRTIHEQRSVS